MIALDLDACRVDASGILSVEKAESVIKRIEQVEVEEPVLEAAEAAAGNETATDDAEVSPACLLSQFFSWLLFSCDAPFWLLLMLQVKRQCSSRLTWKDVRLKSLERYRTKTLQSSHVHSVCIRHVCRPNVGMWSWLALHSLLSIV